MSFTQSTSVRNLTCDLLEDLTGLQSPMYSPVKPASSIDATRTPHHSRATQVLPPGGIDPRFVYADVYPVEHRSLAISSRPPSPTLSASSSSSTNSDQSTVTLSAPPPASGYQSQFMRGLRRKKSPQEETLRQLRMKHSEADLQKMYESQTSSYLEGTLAGSALLSDVAHFAGLNLLSLVPMRDKPSHLLSLNVGSECN
jgi:hypothetical protein